MPGRSNYVCYKGDGQELSEAGLVMTGGGLMMTGVQPLEAAAAQYFLKQTIAATRTKH